MTNRIGQMIVVNDSTIHQNEESIKEYRVLAAENCMKHGVYFIVSLNIDSGDDDNPAWGLDRPCWLAGRFLSFRREYC
jgi:hypothetical protein